MRIGGVPLAGKSRHYRLMMAPTFLQDEMHGEQPRLTAQLLKPLEAQQTQL